MIEGGIANGWHAARHAGRDGANVSLQAPQTPNQTGYAIEPCWEIQQQAQGKAFVDFQGDVTLKDIKLAHREGYNSVEHLKRYTTLGMGTDQGKTSNINALAIMAALREVTIPEAGTTTFRPPYAPVAMGALAGRSIALDEPGVERWAIIPKGWTPEVLVA